jgi:hypothetical protein
MMMNKAYKDSLYQLLMVTASGELKRVNVIATSWHDALRYARTKTEYDLNSYSSFRKQWFYLKKYIVKSSFEIFLSPVEIHISFEEAMLRVYEMRDCSIASTTTIFNNLHVISRILINEKIREKRK